MTGSFLVAKLEKFAVKIMNNLKKVELSWPSRRALEQGSCALGAPSPEERGNRMEVQVNGDAVTGKLDERQITVTGSVFCEQMAWHVRLIVV